eukprot:CAMPEP_0202895428 /NCGR_PEP_ID=MMETSP1392-20130828/4636_1 /ASSEMBLY_ACC=CAM_ASM_000868 /TAXON_ID=225041 /ORGANISM="Chlamydomonas chlamydogama, Strain SAG 11-48b" /LENGTH=230 /DNA_ID=CAMNT_0049580437 /DNA_START=138 /DNA_END=827 /DNA_ORIENTATION=+
MARSAAVLLVIAAFGLATQFAAAQQTGIYYWCSLTEGGSNFAYTSFQTRPRSVFALPNITPACHANNIQGGTSFPGQWNNGTNYPGTASPASDYNIAPAQCQTADNWGIDPTQCAVPGYGAPQLFVNGNAPTSYPVTYDRKQACNQIVVVAPLVDKFNSSNIYGQAYVWKDYSDALYVTVSINATNWGPQRTLPFGGVTAPGQFLHAQPSILTNPVGEVGSVSVWSDFLN